MPGVQDVWSRLKGNGPGLPAAANRAPQRRVRPTDEETCLTFKEGNYTQLLTQAGLNQSRLLCTSRFGHVFSLSLDGQPAREERLMGESCIGGTLHEIQVRCDCLCGRYECHADAGILHN